MLSTKEVLEFSGCDASTLKRAILKGEITPAEKRKEGNFYNKDDVLLFVSIIKARQLKHSPQSITNKKKKEKIVIQSEIQKAGVNLSANSELNAIGLDTLQTATKNLIRLGLYDDCDKQILLMYALNMQAFNRFFVLAMQEDCIYSNEAGNISVHPYHKTMQYHEKQAMQYMDRLGLNPLSRQKFPVKEQEEYDEMEEMLKSCCTH